MKVVKTTRNLHTTKKLIRPNERAPAQTQTNQESTHHMTCSAAHNAVRPEK